MRQTNLREGAEKYEQLVYKNANSKVNTLFTLVKVVLNKHVSFHNRENMKTSSNPKSTKLKKNQTAHTRIDYAVFAKITLFCNAVSFLHYALSKLNLDGLTIQF